jgi:2-dehydro-3-deoxygalactonokinase
MIVGDWGTSHLRLYRIEHQATVGKLEGPGIGQLTGSPADALRTTLGPWMDFARERGLLLCGMAGARGGLVETPYVPCPTALTTLGSAATEHSFDSIRLRIVPGLRTTNFLDRPDVMRGEETQIAGALELEPGLARGRHLLVLPGTHCKWVEIDDGRVLRFHSFPTGELFALIQRGSTLAGDGEDEADVAVGFAAGVDRAQLSEPLAALFEARAARLLHGRSAGWAFGFVSGVLIGGEAREGLRLAGHPEQLWLIGAASLCMKYDAAIEAAGAVAHRLDGDACVVAGLSAIAGQWTLA